LKSCLWINSAITNHHRVKCFDQCTNEVVMNDRLAIALCTASPSESPSVSDFKQDYLRFWATGEGTSLFCRVESDDRKHISLAGKQLKQGDRIGWSILFPVDEVNGNKKKSEQLVICYLTINARVSYARVLYQPTGGFYPVVIAPPNGKTTVFTRAV
jgi:hypothetical protein